MQNSLYYLEIIAENEPQLSWNLPKSQFVEGRSSINHFYRSTITNCNDRRTLWWAEQQRRTELERGKHRGEPHFLPLTPPQKVFGVNCFIFEVFVFQWILFSSAASPASSSSSRLSTLSHSTSEKPWQPLWPWWPDDLKTWWPWRPWWSWWFQRISIWDLLLSGEIDVITFFFEETDSPLTKIWRIQDRKVFGKWSKGWILTLTFALKFLSDKKMCN